MQANIVEDLTQEIYDNASNLGQGVSIGGFVFEFEFNDEWWKYQGGGWGARYRAILEQWRLSRPGNPRRMVGNRRYQSQPA